MLGRLKSPVARLSFAYLLGCAVVSRASLGNDFSDYPQNAQDCLYGAADNSLCSGDTAQELNGCLCGSDSSFVSDTAICLGKNDIGDLGAVYDALELHCSDSSTPVYMTRSRFIATGQESSSDGPTTTESTSATGPTSTTGSASTSTGVAKPTQTGENDEDRRLSSGAVIGIAVGTSIAGCALLGLLGLLVFQRRRRGRAAREESHPMLASKFGGPGGPRGLEDPGSKWRTSQGFTWESPYEAFWSESPHGQTWDRSPSDQAADGRVYELAGVDATPPMGTPATAYYPSPTLGPGREPSGAGWSPAAELPGQQQQR